MAEFSLEEVHEESKALKRMLMCLFDENIELKNKFSAILKNQFDKNLLESIEDFQTGLLKEDALISQLRKDTSDYDKLIKQEICDDGKIIQEIKERQKKLRNNITDAACQFKEFQIGLDCFISENI